MTTTDTATAEDPHLDPDVGFDDDLLIAGGIGGLLAGMVMGLLMHYQMGIMEAVGGLYALDSATFGWVFHMIHAVLFGVVFAMGIQWQPFGKYDFGPVAIALLGVAWGVALWMVAAGVIMPVWLDAMGLSAPELPNWATESGVGHLLYGSVLGVVTAIASRL